MKKKNSFTSRTYEYGSQEIVNNEVKKIKILMATIYYYIGFEGKYYGFKI